MANETQTFTLDDLQKVIAEMSVPGVTIWNRLEGRPRADKFDRALRAEVRDPLWMLTRQWQMGEFRGDDTGSPIAAKVRLETTRIRKFQAPGGPVEPFDDNMPLEARVEPLSIPFTQAKHGISLDIRLLMGRQWMKLIKKKRMSAAVRSEYLDKYRVHTPNPLVATDAPTCAHPEVWSAFAAVAGRCMDGGKLYLYLKDRASGDHAHRASDGIASLAGSEPAADALGDGFVAWCDRLFCQPKANSAWLPDRLEYQFACSAPGAGDEKVLVAEEYFQGHLDWYNFDVDPNCRALGDTPTIEPPVATTRTMMPTQVTFNGMPNTRWWTLEDGRTNFGDIKPDTTDLAKLLLIEFGLVYANDWFLIPFNVPAGTIANVRGLAVTNVFGERTWVEPAGRGDDDDWQRWAMFLVSINGKGHEPADLSLVIPPAAQKVLEGPPLEDVMLARDEMANMVWALEKIVPLPSGEPKRGYEAATELRAFFERDLERRLGAPPQPPALAEGAKIRYKVMNTVPENWIPMVPTHVNGDNRAIQLQRAAMPRIIEGDPADPTPVRPRTSLLRQGLDEVVPVPYFIHEEEVPRAGVRVTASFQRTRWRDGRAWLWFGACKQTGRGEGSSGLAFDRIIDVPR